MSPKKKTLSLLLLLPLLHSCFYYHVVKGFDFHNNLSDAPMTHSDEKSYLSFSRVPASGVYEEANLNLGKIGEGLDYHYLPATGDSKILVVPVQFSDDKFTATELTRLKETFFGTSDDTYWESVASFYEKSSGNKVHLSGTVTKAVTISDTISGFTKKAKSASGTYTDSVLYSAISALATSSSSNPDPINLSDYDSNDDGYVDAVWMVYSAPYDPDESDVWWAYTTWASLYDKDGNPLTVSGKRLSCYSWASIDFLLEGYSSSAYPAGRQSLESAKLKNGDAHTFIHETGHMMGLDDYYSYDYSSSERNYDTPVGGVDMMDFNIGDHDAFSKYLLGWYTPTVLTDAYLKANNYTVTLRDFESTGASFLLPCSSQDGRDPFGEYLLLQFYTPTGLNAFDTVPYTNALGTYKTYGVQVFHVDNRIGKVVYDTDSKSLRWDGNVYAGIPGPDSDIGLGEDHVYLPIFSNTKSRSFAKLKETDEYYRGRLISLLPATGWKIQGAKTGYSKDSSLFTEGASFGRKDGIYSTFSFDDGTLPSYGFTVGEVSKSDVQLKFFSFGG